MKKYLGVIVAIFVLVSLPSISAFEYQEINKEIQARAQQSTTSLIDQIKTKLQDTYLSLKENQLFIRLQKAVEKLFNEGLTEKNSLLHSRLFQFLDDGNFSSLDLIMALIGTVLFFILTQPIFLQLIVETGNDIIFVILVLSLIVIEVGQKFFALKVIGVWDQYIAEDIDGFWNFFSIVFFSIYFKIYLSYLPTFIIQYSTVIVKAFFYILMFAIPILFNFFIGDSMDLIDWNGDEWEDQQHQIASILNNVLSVG